VCVCFTSIKQQDLHSYEVCSLIEDSRFLPEEDIVL
jgi:hypothetical protein